MDHSAGLRYRIVEIDTDAFEQFYAVVLFPPRSYRNLYDSGAPVVVTSMQSIGIGKAWADEPRSFLPVELGAVEVQPVHPGWMAVGMGTTGIHDGAGPQTAASLSVALDFALGNTATSDGLSLRDLVNREVCTGAVAILGASSGGITAATALRMRAAELQGKLIGASFYETPSLPMFVVGDTGFKSLDRWPGVDTDGNGVAWDEGRNPNFSGCDLDALQCEVDLTPLAWSSLISPMSVAPTDFSPGASGILYLDRNENGRLDVTPAGHPDTNSDGMIGPDEDYFFLPYQDLREGAETQMYSPQIAQAAQTLFAVDGPPSHVASPLETNTFWEARNAVHAVTLAAEDLDPEVRFSIAFSDQDHAVPVGERPHMAVLYAALHQSGQQVRTNLDLAAAQCLVGADILEDWEGGGDVGADWVGDDLVRTAMPSTIPPRTTRALATLGLFWDRWGPFDVCPEGLSN